MAKKRHGLRKAAEECAELVVELMKLATFPNGKHPSRRRSLVISTEEELADVLAAVDCFIDRNKLDRVKIERRKALKYKKFSKWWVNPRLASSSRSTTRARRRNPRRNEAL